MTVLFLLTIGGPPPGSVPAETPALEWRSIGDGEREARSTGRPVLYFFTADWCPACLNLERTVLADPEVASIIERSFVPVEVKHVVDDDGELPRDIAALQFRFMVSRYPTLIVARPGAGPAVSEEGSPGRTGVLAFFGTARSRLAGLESEADGRRRAVTPPPPPAARTRSSRR